jgi:glutathione S-transferase
MMIELYTWTTPNGQKISIMLEEVGLPYHAHAIDITKGEQFHPDFLKISPNNKIPAIVDTDNGLHLMESGAILLYLADKTGKLWPQDFPTKWRVVEWLMWQMGGPGPFFGQVHHFVKFNPGRAPTPRSAMPKRRSGFGGCSTGGLPRSSMLPAITRSPTSPFGRGSPVSVGRPSISPSTPTSSAGT